MEFPHLKDTKFPLIDNVNVYKYQNNFDYARWQGKVSYKLLNVRWNSLYNDVPYFDSVEDRDEWFDSKDGIVGTLESAFNNTPKNTLKVPLPFNDMYHCNYLMIDMPIQTSQDNPINYGNEGLRVKRWFFFIKDMQQFAPSTTQLEIEVDYWTTFIHSVEIPYLMLERGHAPMMQTTVEQFLQNPIMNNEYLLANDFNFGDTTVIQTSTYKPIGNGKKYVLFCAPYQRDRFNEFNTTDYNGNSTPPTFTDADNRWGWRLNVEDYEWKYGNVNYSNADIPITNVVQTGILNGCDCYAIEGTQAQAFFNECARHCVNFIHGIQAMFILDEDMFTRSNEFSFRGYTIYVADRKINHANFNFTKAQFGFDSKYADITKLYTAPYSELEITDDEGNTFNAKIENCGNVAMREEVSLVYPFLNYNVFFTGINGDGTMQYTWKTISDGDDTKLMWASDFSKFMMNWKIPVYSIFVSGEAEYSVNNFFDVQSKRAKAIKDYQNAMRFANTTYENVKDTMATNVANVAATGATNVENIAATGQTNVDNTAASGQTDVDNTDATGLQNYKNTQRSTKADVDNTYDSMDVYEANAKRTNETVRHNATDGVYVQKVNTDCATETNEYITNTIHNPKMATVNDYNANKIDTDYQIAAGTAMTLTGAQNDFAMVSNGISQGASVASSVIGGIGGIASLTNEDGASVIGSLVGINKSLIGAIASGAITTQTVSTNTAITSAQNNANAAYAQQAIILGDRLNGSNDRGGTGVLQIENSQTMQAENASATQQAGNLQNLVEGGSISDINGYLLTLDGTSNRTKTTNDKNAEDTAKVNKDNADRSKTAADTNANRTRDINNDNADRTRGTNNDNADRTRDTNNDNADRTRDTENANAEHIRNTTYINERANLIYKQTEVSNQYENTSLHAPVKYSEYSGDFAPDVYQRRGIRFNVRTQSKSAIAQAGDAMLRFGYALHRVWDMSAGFHYCNNFTFWKAEDIWINDGTGVANIATNTIARILLSGVTVWRDADKIGTVGIYDNITEVI